MAQIKQFIISSLFLCIMASAFSQTKGKLFFEGEPIGENIAISCIHSSTQSNTTSNGNFFSFDFEFENGFFIFEHQGIKYASDTLNSKSSDTLSFELSELYKVLEGSVSGTLSKSTYIVPDIIQIDETDTLIIEAGAVLKFDNAARLSIYGNILCNGGRKDSVTFCPIRESWLGFRFNKADTVNFTYTAFKGIKDFSAFDFSSTPKVTFKHCLFSEFHPATEAPASCFTLTETEVEVSSSQFISLSTAVLDMSNSKASFLNSIFAHCETQTAPFFKNSTSNFISQNCTFDRLLSQSTIFHFVHESTDIDQISNSIISNCKSTNGLISAESSKLSKLKIANTATYNNIILSEQNNPNYTYVIDGNNNPNNENIMVFNAEPSYMNGDKAIYLLNADSELIDKGNDETAPEDDIFGQTRKINSDTTTNKTDIGACEYTPIKSNTAETADIISTCSETLKIHVNRLSEVYSEQIRHNTTAPDTAIVSVQDSIHLQIDYFGYLMTDYYINTFKSSEINFSKIDTVCPSSVKLDSHPSIPFPITWESDGGGHFSDSKEQQPTYYFSTTDFENGTVSISAKLTNQEACELGNLEYKFILLQKRDLIKEADTVLCQPGKITFTSIDNDSLYWNNSISSTSYSFIPRENTQLIARKRIGNCLLKDTVNISMKLGQMADFELLVDNSSLQATPSADLNGLDYKWHIGNQEFETFQLNTSFDSVGINKVCLEVNNTETGCLSQNCKDAAIAFTRYNLGGQVFASGIPVDSATAYLYKLAFDELELISEFRIKEYGYFAFRAVPSGNYTVYIDDIYTNQNGYFIPTYYGNDTWSNSFQGNYISLNDTIYDADIYLYDYNSEATDIKGNEKDQTLIWPTIAENYIYCNSSLDENKTKIYSTDGVCHATNIKDGKISTEKLKKGWYLLRSTLNGENIYKAFYKK